MNRRYFSLVLAILLGVALVLAPLTSFAGAADEVQPQVVSPSMCPGHEYITQDIDDTRAFWANNNGHIINEVLVQICKHCGFFTQYVYVPLTDEVLPHKPDTSRWVGYHPANDNYHYFHRVCTECYGQAGEDEKAPCPGDKYGHVTHP